METFEKLTLEDLQALIKNKEPENNQLDYKASEAINKLVKSSANKDWIIFLADLTSMANANGGRIIYGLKENRVEKKNCPEKFDEGIIASNDKLTLDALSQNIRNRTQPTLKFESYFINHPDSGNPNLIYVFDIQRSDRAIQVIYDDDCRYYQRQQTSNLVMQHWQIEDVNNRTKGPDLDLVIKSRNTYFNNFQSIHLDLTAVNQNPVIADYLMWYFRYDSALNLDFSDKNFTRRTPSNFQMLSSIYGQSSTKAKFVQDIETGIFEDKYNGNSTESIQVKLKEEQLGQNFKIYWELNSPNMNKKCGYYQLTCKQDKETQKYQINLKKMKN